MVKNKEKSFGYIYRATNIQNGKMYVGQTVSSRWGDDKNPIEERWKEEVREAYSKQKRGEILRYIENAIIKYGPENFKLKEEDIAHNQEDLDEKETHYIREYDTMNPAKGYNLREGGLGGRLSDITKEKMSETSKEMWQDPEYRQKQSEINKERWQNPEYREKIINGVKEYWNDPVHIEEKSEEMKNRWEDPEYRKEMSNLSKERWEDPEYREKMSEIRKETWQDPKYQEMQSKINKERWQDPEYREKHVQERTERQKDPEYRERVSNTMKDHWKNPDYREKMSQISKERWENLEYKEKQQKIIKERWQDPEFKEKMSNIKKEIAKDPEFKEKMSDMSKKLWDNESHREKMSNYSKARWQNPEYKEKLSNTHKEKWQDPEYRDKQLRARENSKKHIKDKSEFLEDVKNRVKYKELARKNDMGTTTLKKKIQEMFGPNGPKNYTELKDYMQDKNIKDVLKDIERKSNEKHDDIQVSNNNLDDSVNESREESDDKVPDQKSDEGETDIPIEGNSEKLSGVNKEETEEILSDETTSGKDYDGIDDSSDNSGSITENKVLKSSEGVNESEKLEMSISRDKPPDQNNDNFAEKLNDLKKRGFVDTYGKSDEDVITLIGDLERARKPSSNIGSDYDGIDKSSESESEDYRDIDVGLDEGRQDFEGIDKPLEEGSEDYQGIDEEHGGSEYGGEA